MWSASAMSALQMRRTICAFLCCGHCLLPAARSASSSSLSNLHIRSKHSGRYDFAALSSAEPSLSPFIHISPKTKEETIDWSNPKAVYAFNKALLRLHYDVQDWAIPDGYLVPPIPSRAEYIHHIADLIDYKNKEDVVGLDIGCGANCVYPLIATSEYSRWRMIGTDVDEVAIKFARMNAAQRSPGRIVIRAQRNKMAIFSGVISESDKIDFSMCNPPFSRSLVEQNKNSLRKLRGLNKDAKSASLERNFQGNACELSCEGGEIGFVSKMILESGIYCRSVGWFTTLVSRGTNVDVLVRIIKQQSNVKDFRIVDFSIGSKLLHVLCWTFSP